jgi:hypothetical protein
MKTTLFKPKQLSTKTKIIVSKEIVINLKLVLLSLIITFIAFIVFYFALKPNKQEIQNRITIEQERIADSIAKNESIFSINFNVKKYYNYLKNNGADVAQSVESFYKTLLEKDNAEKYYKYLKENKFDVPDSYDSFINTLGLSNNINSNDFKIILQDYVAAANSAKYNTIEELNAKFLELNYCDKNVLADYIATANSPKYKSNWDIINSKFPEFFGKNNTMPANNLQKLYNLIFKEYDDYPDYNTFVKDMKNEKNIKDLYTNLTKENKYNIPDYNTFIIDMGFKIEKNLAVNDDLLTIISSEYEHKMTNFKEEIKDRTLYTFILSLFGLILGRYFYKITNIALKRLIILVKAIKKYSKMDL